MGENSVESIRKGPFIYQKVTRTGICSLQNKSITGGRQFNTLFERGITEINAEVGATKKFLYLNNDC